MTRRVFLGLAAMAAVTQSLWAGRKGGGGGTLNAEQKADLLFMYQEEKVARDVYIVLGQKFPSAQQFANIQLSEQNHMDAVENLCIKYGVDISGVNETKIGEFVLPELQNLYNTLVVQGSASLLAAMKVGVAIEEKDIADLTDAMNGMPSDVVKVFTNLRNGSYNHLQAFQNGVAAAS